MIDFSLDIIGNEWIIIIFVALVLLLGGKRLPEASRKMGKIMGEYNRTKNVVREELQKAQGDFIMQVQGPVMSERQKLENIARSLGIDSANKTDDDLRDLITSKIGRSNSMQGSDQPSK